MNVFVESISKGNEPRRLVLGVRVGSEVVKNYQAEYDDSTVGYKFCTVDQELFMQLSSLAQQRYCNCAIYQMEMMGILEAYVHGKVIPIFPIELGTTNFGLRRPSVFKIWFNRMRSPFYRAWGFWKYRHIRRENKLKYGTTKRSDKS